MKWLMMSPKVLLNINCRIDDVRLGKKIVYLYNYDLDKLFNTINK